MTKIKVKDLLEGKLDAKAIKALKFEQGLELVETLVDKVNSDELELESSLLAYETGTKLLKHLESMLGDAEKKLEVLKKK